MKWTRWPPYLAQTSTGSVRDDKVVATLENSTRGVAGLGSDSVGVDCCGGAPSAGCSVDARTTETVRTDFGNTAESGEIELVGVV
jgi:hypothetical protein